jgi:hypothetical protein
LVDKGNQPVPFPESRNSPAVDARQNSTSSQVAAKPQQQELAPPIPLDLDEISPLMWKNRANFGHLWLKFYLGLDPNVTAMLVELNKPLPKRNMGIVRGALLMFPMDLLSKVEKCPDDDCAIYLFSSHDPRLGALRPGLRLKFLYLTRRKRGRPTTRDVTMEIEAYLEADPDYKSSVDKRLLALADKRLSNKTNKPRDLSKQTKDLRSALRQDLAVRIFGDYWKRYRSDIRDYLNNRENQLLRRTRHIVRRRRIARRAARP